MFLELTEYFSEKKILINVNNIVKISTNYDLDPATNIICNGMTITVKESYEKIKDTIDYYLIRYRE